MSEGGNNNSNSQSDAQLVGELYELCRSDSLSEEGLGGILIMIPTLIIYSTERHASMKRVQRGILRCLLEYFPNLLDILVRMGEVAAPFDMLQQKCHTQHDSTPN
jgi:hypothetical protein